MMPHVTTRYICRGIFPKVSPGCKLVADHCYKVSYLLARLLALNTVRHTALDVQVATSVCQSIVSMLICHDAVCGAQALQQERAGLAAQLVAASPAELQRLRSEAAALRERLGALSTVKVLPEPWSVPV